MMRSVPADAQAPRVSTLPHSADETALTAAMRDDAPSPALCECARRVMCSYRALADRVFAAAWACHEEQPPHTAHVLLQGMTYWEGDVREVRVVCVDYELEACLLRHAACLRGVRSLDLTALERRRCPEGLASILSRMPQLQYLDLTCRNVRGEDMRALEPGLAGLTRLRSLKVGYNPLQAEGVAALARCLAHMPLLEELNISGARVDEHVMLNLEPAFAHLARLRSLGMASNTLSAAAAATLTRCLRNSTQLEKLVLSDCIDPAGVLALEPMFEGVPSLKTLDLSWNRIDAVSAAALARGLARTSRLETLDLEGMIFGADAIPAVEPAFAYLSCLTMLNMSNIQLGIVGAATLSACLTHTHQLHFLLLDCADLNDAAMAALEPGLSLLHMLRSLTLQDNPLGPTGAASLARCLACMSEVRLLCVANTGLDEASKEVLRASAPSTCNMVM